MRIGRPTAAHHDEALPTSAKTAQMSGGRVIMIVASVAMIELTGSFP